MLFHSYSGILWTVIAFTLVLSSSAVAFGAPTIELARTRIESRVRQLATIDLTWKMRTHYTHAHGVRLRATPFNEKSKNGYGSFPITIEWFGHLQCAESKLRLDSDRPTWMFERSSFLKLPESLGYDGQVGRYLRTFASEAFPHQGYMSHDPMHSTVDNDFSLFVWHVRAFCYPEMLGTPFFGAQVKSSYETLDGRSCFVLKYRNERSARGTEHIMWLDPDAEYAIRRLACMRDGTIKYDYRVENQRMADVILPMRWKYEEYNPQGELLVAKAAEIVTAEINKPIAATTFAVVFPVGAVVNDQRGINGRPERRIIIGTGGKEHEITNKELLDNPSSALMLARFEGDRAGIVTYAIIFVAGVFTVLAVGLGIVRQYKARNVYRVAAHV